MMESERRKNRMGSLGLKALITSSLLASPLQAQHPTRRVETASASRVESHNPQTNEYCRRLVAAAWAMVRSGRIVEAGPRPLSFDAVLDCFDDDAERTRFMDAHDAVERRTGGPGSQVASQN
jgi:hypothetical protein